MQITKKLYPTPEECQYTTSDRIKATVALAYLNQIIKKQPDETEADVYITGWQGIALHIDRQETAAEISERQLGAARQAFQALIDTSDDPKVIAWAKEQMRNVTT